MVATVLGPHVSRHVCAAYKYIHTLHSFANKQINENKFTFSHTYVSLSATDAPYQREYSFGKITLKKKKKKNLWKGIFLYSFSYFHIYRFYSKRRDANLVFH